jgi:hypothetical protein
MMMMIGLMIGPVTTKILADTHCCVFCCNFALRRFHLFCCTVPLRFLGAKKLVLREFLCELGSSLYDNQLGCLKMVCGTEKQVNI